VAHLVVTRPELQHRLLQLQEWMQQLAPGGGRARDQALKLLSQEVDRQAALLAYADVFRWEMEKSIWKAM
jgi:hypothetical protein